MWYYKLEDIGIDLLKSKYKCIILPCTQSLVLPLCIILTAQRGVGKIVHSIERNFDCVT